MRAVARAADPAHGRGAAATRLTHLVRAAGRAVSAGVLARVDHADAVAQAVGVAAARRPLDTRAVRGVTHLRALTVGVGVTSRARDAEACDALVARTAAIIEARVHAEALITQTVAQAVFVCAAERGLHAATVAAAELRAIAVVVIQALRVDLGQHTVPGIADLTCAAVGVRTARAAAHAAVAHPTLVAVGVALAEGALDAAAAHTRPSARAVAVAHARGAGGCHTLARAADLLGWALQVALAAARRRVDNARALLAHQAIRAGATGARRDARAAPAESVALAVQVGGADLRLGAQAGRADLLTGAVGVGAARACGKGHAQADLARPVRATVGGLHAGELAATKIGRAAQVAAAGVGGCGVAAVRAGAVDANAA